MGTDRNGVKDSCMIVLTNAEGEETKQNGVDSVPDNTDADE